MKISEIRRKIDYCIDRFYENDIDLLNRDNYEVTITAKFASYLASQFSSYTVDCEYNKHLASKKDAIVNGIPRLVRPDIVIHSRGTNQRNLVCIEIKTDHNGDNRDEDVHKLIGMTKNSLDKKYAYNYTLGVFLDFYRDKSRLVKRFFINGKEVT